MCLLSLSLADAVHPEGTPWILPRLDPSTKVFIPTPTLITDVQK